MDILTTLHTMQAEIALAVILIVVLLTDLFLKTPSPKVMQRLSCVLLVLLLPVTLTSPYEVEAFGGMYQNTAMTSVAKTLLTAGTLLVFLQANPWLEREDTRHKAGEFYLLTLSTLLGMFYMISAGNVLLLYVGLELASIPMACLVAFDKFRHHSAEAGAKFILSAMFSSALMLYGLSLVYGTCGTMYFADLSQHMTGTPLQILAIVLFFAGMGFKLSLVPFHMWTPDTYEGAPTCVSAYLSVISKGAAAFTLLNALVKAFGPMASQWEDLAAVVIILSITLANVLALLQHDMKRFMAYSSISQAGYLILAVLGTPSQGAGAMAYYVAVYVVANLAVFGVISTVEQNCGGRTDREAYNRFYQTNPRLSLVMTAGLFSLAGIPPFAGFFSKFMVFAAAFHAGHWMIVFLALVNTVISLYYYLLVVKAIFITPAETNPLPKFTSSGAVRAALAICLAAICLIGICPQAFDWMTQAAQYTFGHIG